MGPFLKLRGAFPFPPHPPVLRSQAVSRRAQSMPPGSADCSMRISLRSLRLRGEFPIYALSRSTAPSVPTSSSICASLMISGGDSAMVSPVTRARMPFSRHLRNTG